MIPLRNGYMTDMHERTRLLVGEENFKKLQSSTAMIVGVGGVGSIAAESLARSGIKKLVLIDGDDIDITNLNRQIQTNQYNIGESKVKAMADHLHRINPEIIIDCHQMFFDGSSEELFEDVDFVVDAIDTITHKMDLIEICLNKEIPFVSSMGMGNRLDPSQVFETTLDKTSHDAIARIMRGMARKRNIDMKKVPVVLTKEEPIIQYKIVNEDGETRKEKQPPASMLLVPPAAGLMCASICIRTLISE